MPKWVFTLAALAAIVLMSQGSAWAHGRGVQATLDRAAADGRIDAAVHARYTHDWSRLRRAARRLHGSSRSNVRGVLADTWSLARRGMLEARLVPVFLIVERNNEWFWQRRRGPAAYGARRTFDGSPVIFEFYPGAGWQIQPLANFGRLNGLAAAKHTRLATLTRYADALLPLAVRRKGFLAFEYYFPWSGGRPGWISGMATATGMAALARVWRRTGDGRYRDAVQDMLGAFSTPPPWGIRLNHGHGRAHYLQYSQDPGLLVGNAFSQSLIGLDDVVHITGDSRAKLALERGLRQARARLARFDTGAWSLYWRRPGTRHGGESDLHYHQLFEGFLAKLCTRFGSGPFCRMHDHFARYETEPVRIGHLRTARRGRTLHVRVWTSKRGYGTLSLRLGRRTVVSVALSLWRGTHSIVCTIPKRHRHYKLRLDATSLNGVRSTAGRTLAVH